MQTPTHLESRLSQKEIQFLESYCWKSIPSEEDYVIQLLEDVKKFFDGMSLKIDPSSKTIYSDFLVIFKGYNVYPDIIFNWFEEIRTKLRSYPLFCVIRGTQISGWDTVKLRVFYQWICENIGQLDYTKWPFYEVYDRWGNYWLHQRFSDTKLSLGYHTDSTQMDNLPKYVWLLCIVQSHTWWENKLINMNTIYQKLLEKYPAKLSVLESEYFRDSSNVINSYPIFQWINDELIFRYARQWIEVGYKSLWIKLQEDKEDAINTLEEFMSSEIYTLQFKMKEGDILFFDNTTLAHDRTKFEDGSNSKRLLTRSWIYRWV